MPTGRAKTWETLWELDEIGAAAAWYRGVVSLGIVQAQVIENEAPDFSDVEEIVKGVLDGDPPKWWPKRLGRMMVKLRVTNQDRIPDVKEGAPIDPAPSKDLGWRACLATLKHLSNQIPLPFQGSIEVMFLDLNAQRKQVGGFNVQCRVGDKLKGDATPGRGEGDDRLDYALEQLKQRDDVLMKAYTGAPALLHGAAAVIQSTRGVNPAPAWMQDGQGDPFWQGILKAGAEIALPLLMGGSMDGRMGENLGNLANQALQHRGGSGAPGGHPGQIAMPPPGSPRMLTMSPAEARQIDPAGPPLEGEYDGYYIDEQTELIEESANVMPEGFPRAPQDEVDEDEESGEEAQEEEDEFGDLDDDESAPASQRAAKKGNPLDGLSSDEIAAHLEEIMGKRSPAEVKKIGQRLVRKFMGG